MKTLLKSLFVGFVALLTVTTVSAQGYTGTGGHCFSATAEGTTPYTPAYAWTFDGFSISASSPITGQQSFKSTRFTKAGVDANQYELDVQLSTPANTALIMSGWVRDWANLSFNYSVFMGSSTAPVRVKIFTNNNDLLFEGPLGDGAGSTSGSFRLGDVLTDPNAVISVPFNMITIKFITTNTLTNDAWFVKVDDINIGCFEEPYCCLGPQEFNVDAGPDQVISSTSTTLTCSTDVIGNTPTYKWEQVAGPSAATIVSPTSSSTSVTGLVDGVYYFRAEGTFNGKTYTDEVKVTVGTAVGRTIQNVSPWALNIQSSVDSEAIGLDGTATNYQIAATDNMKITSDPSYQYAVVFFLNGVEVSRINGVEDGVFFALPLASTYDTIMIADY